MSAPSPSAAMIDSPASARSRERLAEADCVRDGPVQPGIYRYAFEGAN
ncbi:MAG: hypothetical protein JWM27_1844 [Gemmatimonadetes bacterium]|nr:hypothetical protein [Gemmatimonadota bacterium]